jgi:hypothetical protein
MKKTWTRKYRVMTWKIHRNLNELSSDSQLALAPAASVPEYRCEVAMSSASLTRYCFYRTKGLESRTVTSPDISCQAGNERSCR